MNINKKEFSIGACLLILVVVLGISFFPSDSLIIRMLMGLAIGYTLVRASFGFAGSVNRAYNTGSTKLMRVLMVMFLGTAILVSALVYEDPTAFKMSIYPINIALVLGAAMFGTGMAFASCCASGVLTDLVETPTRGIIILITFCGGVALAFPLQKSDFVTTSLVSTETFPGGVYLPDLFKFDGMNGYLGAIVFFAIMVLIVIGISRAYENKRRKNGTYTGVPCEKIQDEMIRDSLEYSNHKFFSRRTFYNLFVRPWSLKTGAVAMGLIFVYMMAMVGSGWGVTSAFGHWGLRIAELFGASPDALAAYSLQSVESFTGPILESGSSVQNIGIFAGALIAALLAGSFKKTVSWKIGLKDFFLCVASGLLMGVGTRLANGCNAGGLFTPIAQLSLSGWIFLAFMVVGGIFGNMLKKKIMAGKS